MGGLKIDLTKSAVRPQATASDLAGLLGGQAGKPGPLDAGKVVLLPLETLHSFSRHTYRVVDDDEMTDLIQSILENGILTPIYARPHDGGYEIISGHRRTHAARLAHLTQVPCIVEALDDDTAAIRTVETNRYRDSFLPSERAFSYKLAADALNRQGKRTDLYGSGEKSGPTLTEVTGEKSERTIRNWIRLTYLVQPLLDMVDCKELLLGVGVSLSYLSQQEQTLIHAYITENHKKISVGLAEDLRRYHNETGPVDLSLLTELLEPTDKQPQIKPFRFRKRELAQICDCIPTHYRAENAGEYIIKALQFYANTHTE